MIYLICNQERLQSGKPTRKELIIMENKKMTKKEMFGEILKRVSDNTEMVEFLNHEIELLERKASKSTQTKTQKENEGIKEIILNALTEIGKPVTITELQNANTELAEFSKQKISALLKQLVDSQVVDKMIDKKKSYFTVKSV